MILREEEYSNGNIRIIEQYGYIDVDEQFLANHTIHNKVQIQKSFWIFKYWVDIVHFVCYDTDEDEHSYNLTRCNEIVDLITND